MGDWLYLIIGIAVIGLLVMAGLVVRGRRTPVPPSTSAPDVITPQRELPDSTVGIDVPETATPTLEKPEGTASRLVRLRQRLSRSQGALGKGLLALLSGTASTRTPGRTIEDTLLTADIGVAPTQELVDKLRTRLRVEGARGRRRA